ncbi:hypothetical protein CUZ56_02666 [Saezia sanguinis]|uniref:DUF1287 domain-containing protein n=1 Tax=Saezia sanguinis TaxID=1965230 RepID=A0A433SAQ7_9BURK|nr:DUF1287 domain-containing protein [Saezia sanguinis]RUS65821.1 hypothetical protein CUZ56_02666 [Saezia sanguinis]
MKRRIFILGALSGAITSPALTSLAWATPTSLEISEAAKALVGAAREQVGSTLIYDGSYVRLDYPGGDVPMIRGVCTDVVVRAYRTAFGYDLQKTVHEDMQRAFSAYPSIWGMSKPDRNIDHRRVPNLQTFFKRQRAALAVTDNAQDYAPGDLVTYMLGGNRPHIAIVSDRYTMLGKRPYIIHNIGLGAREDDMLMDFKMTGHYRFFPA